MQEGKKKLENEAKLPMIFDVIAQFRQGNVIDLVHENSILCSLEVSLTTLFSSFFLCAFGSWQKPY